MKPAPPVTRIVCAKRFSLSVAWPPRAGRVRSRDTAQQPQKTSVVVWRVSMTTSGAGRTAAGRRDDCASFGGVRRGGMEIERSSGVLLHPTSLPGGRLGDDAYRFVDWLEAAGQSWWQLLPLGPPDDTGSPYRAASAFACWRGLLADPDADVSRAEVEDFVARHPYWTGSWAAFAGEGALADQVRFEREWGALRSYAADRGVRLIGDLPIYVAPDGADAAGWPELF